jgi:alkyl sulfatase BDS1-like metallo-beta-lactamase superfamily hydrolase
MPSSSATHTLDGLDIEFQMAPNTEAPAEMHLYFPRYRALYMAENATHTRHNLLTLRGALVRDPHVYLSAQRDIYAYLHDQTLRFINKGYTGTEIAEMIKLPRPWNAHHW